MDHIKVVISLALIVSGIVATLGSPITGDYKENSEENSEGKELEALLMQSNQSDPIMETDAEMSPNNQEQKGLILIAGDQDNKKTKRYDAGDIIAGSQLALDVLKSILDGENFARMVAIGIDNESGYQWEGINVYFFSGTSDATLPHIVPSGKALLYEARKSKWSLRGAVGVMTYHIPTLKKTMAVMFSVPYSQWFYDNWWKVELYDGKKTADKDLFTKMYRDDPIKGDDSWHSESLGVEDLKVNGYMSSSSKAALEIKVHDC